MHHHKNSTEKTISLAEKYPEAGDQNEFKICENMKCAHYDEHDPGGNNCTLLFALSEEGCGTRKASHN